MAQNEWETVIQAIVEESNREPQPAGKQRVLKAWRTKLEREHPQLPLHQIDEIVREVRRRLSSTEE